MLGREEEMVMMVAAAEADVAEEEGMEVPAREEKMD